MAKVPAKKEETEVSPYDNIDVEIMRTGKHITLPDDPQPMTYDEGIKALMRKRDEEEEEVSVTERVNAFYYDGLAAFARAMRNLFGWTQAIPIPTWFGAVPPQVVSIEVGYGVTMQCLSGRFSIPNVEGWVSTGAWEDNQGRTMFQVQAVVKRKHEHVIRALAKETRAEVLKSSIYKGKAIRLTTHDDGTLNGEAPSFFDLSKASDMVLIFSKDVETQIDVNLLSLIRYTSAVRKHKIPLKRGILLAGKYGTGKTLTATKTAEACEANGWTFILLDRVAGLSSALAMARLYQPAVVFAEDIDRVISGQERTTKIDDILNTVDGVESKSAEIIVVLTSNHMEKINQAMLRPGRLDAVIEILPPDAEAAQRLMKHYSAGLIPEDVPLPNAGAELAGQIPATIREVTERAKLYALTLSYGQPDITLTDEALTFSARQMKAHLDLLNEDREPKHTPEHEAGAAIRELMAQAKGGLTNADRELLRSVAAYSERVQASLGSMENTTAQAARGVQASTDKNTKALVKVKEDTEVIRDAVVS
jgi:transitional endoplasmic reticulum ATPase